MDQEERNKKKKEKRRIPYRSKCKHTSELVTDCLVKDIPHCVILEDVGRT
jgi:hypothetical protein